MDSPIETPVVTHSLSAHKRRSLLITIIVLAILAIGWLLIARHMASRTGPLELTVSDKQAILNKVVADSKNVTVADSQKTALLKAVDPNDQPAGAKSNVPVLTSQQKASILQSVVAGSAQVK